MNNLTVCGGLDERDQTFAVCFRYDFVSGWYNSHNLVNLRSRHVSWDVEGSLYLIGGIDIDALFSKRSKISWIIP